MAYGAKDWVARSDILLQTLSEMIVRLKYGTRGVLEFSNYVAASTVTSLGIVTGKGVIYGGALITQGAASQKADQPGSALDGGTQYFAPSIDDSNKFSLLGPHGCTWQLECFDEVNFRYAGALGFGITFETSFELLYKEIAGNTPYVVAKLMYAVV